MKDKIQTLINKEKLCHPEDHLLLAVSGGKDSMALFDYFFKSSYKISVAHCNFNLRLGESDGDEQLVKDMCKEREVDFYSKSFDTKKEAKENLQSIQIAARELRYRWFESLRNEIGAKYVVTAHHLDDQLETVLINLCRGTGIEGLTGIPAVNKHIIRPLLAVSREEIETYCESNDVVFRDDSSNESTKYLRNKIRHEVVPVLKEINPSLLNGVRKTLRNLQQVEGFWKLNYLEWKKSNFNDGIISVSQERIQKKEEGSFISYLLNEMKFSAADIEIVFNVQQKPNNGAVLLSKDFKLMYDRGWWKSFPVQQKSGLHRDKYSVDDPELPIVLKLEEIGVKSDFEYSTNLAYIDAEKIEGELLVRKWMNGDKFVPFGMKGSKKLSDFFIDMKISNEDKKNVWLLCDEKNIIWLIGVRMDNRYRITDKTKNVTKIKLV